MDGLLDRLPLAIGAIVSVTSGLALDGPARIAAVPALLAGILGRLRLAGRQPLPRTVFFSTNSGWWMIYADAAVAVELGDGSFFGRRWALLRFADGSRRRWLILLRRPRRRAGNDWRRLRLLWRTAPDTLVRNSSNC